MQRLDYYEFLGYLAPGGAMLFGLSRIYPEVNAALAASSLTIGDLGIFVILSYATGHAVQAIGNVIEAAWWGLWGGWPSDWPRSSKHALLSPGQLHVLPQRVAALLGTEAQVPLPDYDKMGWQAVVSQIGAALKAANRTERLEVFNGNYGLCRGLLAGAVILIVLSLAELGPGVWKADVALAFTALLMLYRMHRFGWRYQVFLLYEPDVAKLKNLALTLDMAKALQALKKDKRRLVFAPTKYLDQEHLDQYRIDFAQLPFEIYELTR